MFARVVHGRIRTVSLKERREAHKQAADALSRQPGFLGAYYFSPREGEAGLLSISLWETKESALQPWLGARFRAPIGASPYFLSLPCKIGSQR